MVEKLRKRYIVVSMFAILAVMACIIGAIYAVNVIQRNHRSDDMLNYIARQSGHLEPISPDSGKESMQSMNDETQGKAEFESTDNDDDGDSFDDDRPPPDESRNNMKGPGDYGSLYIDEETPFRTRFFSVTYSDGICINCDVSHVAAITEAEAQEYGDIVLRSGKSSGTEDAYRYLVKRNEGSSVIYFLDITEDIRSTRTYLRGSLIVAGISYLVLFVLMYFISKAAVRPVAANIEDQKRFITDAEHEIKTPLAIISANAEVLEMIHGKSEWTSNIRDQVKRSSDLVQRLLILSRADSADPGLTFSDFSLSDAVLETVAPFSAVASSTGKTLSADIEPDVCYKGDERAVRELVSILTDNAIKYCPENGSVSVFLAKAGKKVVLQTENDIADGSSIDTEQLFNRFYRGDESRSRDTGGYGIGLSIARAVVEAHHGSIQVKNNNNRITFTVTL